MDQNSVRSPLSALILGLCLVISAGFIANGYKASKPTDPNSKASFNGTAKQTIESDHAKWSLIITHSAASSEEAMKLVEQDHDALKKLVSDAKVDQADYSFHPATVTTYNYDSYDGGYQTTPPKALTYYASEIVVVDSSKVEELGALAADTMSLQVKNGLQVRTTTIEFTSSKLEDTKKELVKKAIDDAHASAKELLGDQLGSLRNMELPQFSVQPEGSPDYYYQNNPDTSSIKKTITATISVSYNLQ